MRWKHRPTGAHLGEFRVDDQLGRVNLITPGKFSEALLGCDGLQFLPVASTGFWQCP
jgi:hypothetical protein